ncbi:MAG: hypothetical protein S4CHLAM123_15510 [Chlamydiales bacterium]|nr:hypothetical protein [Chlamydiales bacterium]
MSTPISDYQANVNAFKVDVLGSNKPPCTQCDNLASLEVAMKHLKESYFPRPCVRGWPCPGMTQHRVEIDKVLERLQPIKAELTRQCKIQIVQEKAQILFNAAANSKLPAVDQQDLLKEALLNLVPRKA